jgi:hypothetical protein
MDRPPLLDRGSTDVEGAAGIQERRRHAQQLQEDAQTEHEDETPAYSWGDRASNAAAPWTDHLLHPAPSPLKSPPGESQISHLISQIVSMRVYRRSFDF